MDAMDAHATMNGCATCSGATQYDGSGAAVRSDLVYCNYIVTNIPIFISYLPAYPPTKCYHNHTFGYKISAEDAPVQSRESLARLMVS